MLKQYDCIGVQAHLAEKRADVRRLPRLWSLHSRLSVSQAADPKASALRLIHLSSVHAEGTPAPFITPRAGTAIDLDLPLFPAASPAARPPGTAVLPTAYLGALSRLLCGGTAMLYNALLGLSAGSRQRANAPTCTLSLAEASGACAVEGGAQGAAPGGAAAKPRAPLLERDDTALRVAADKRAAVVVAASALKVLAGMQAPALPPGWEIPVTLVEQRAPPR